MIGRLLKRFWREPEASLAQQAFMADIRLASTSLEGDVDEYKARLNGKVDLTFSRRLPDYYIADTNEIFLIDIRSIEKRKGYVKQAFEDIARMAVIHQVDMTVKLGDLYYETPEDFDRLAKIFSHVGFKQNQAHTELFMLEYKDVAARLPEPNPA